MHDPVVEEVRKIREELARENDFDLDTFIRSLQEHEKQNKDRLVSPCGQKLVRGRKSRGMVVGNRANGS